MRLKFETNSLRGMLFKSFKNIQVASWNFKRLCEKVRWKYIKNESYWSYLANNEQKATLPVVSPSSMDISVARPFLRALSGTRPIKWMQWN